MSILWLSISCQRHTCQTHNARSETSQKRSETGGLGYYSCAAKAKSLLPAIRLPFALSDLSSNLLLYSAVRLNIPLSPLFLAARL